MSLGARRIGFVASALLHAGVAGVFLLPGAASVETAPTERLVALSLDMFEAPSADVAPAPVAARSPKPPRPVVEVPPAPRAEEPPRPGPPTPPEPPRSDDAKAPPVQTRKVGQEPVERAPRRPPRKVVARPGPPRRTIEQTTTQTQALPPMAVSSSDPVPPLRPVESAAPSASAVELSRLSQAYLAELVREIHRNKYYPRKARRRAEQGTVLVRFTIEREGGLSAISVASSSGFHRLDDAALETLRRLTPFRPIPVALNRERWPITVPIEFSLR